MRIIKADKMFDAGCEMVAPIKGSYYKTECIGNKKVNGVEEYYWRVLGEVEYSTEWGVVTANEGIIDYLIMED